MHLDRYACYLIANNGDSNKHPVGFAMNYFTIQTRRQELSDLAIPLSENEKRVFLRRLTLVMSSDLPSAFADCKISQPDVRAQGHGPQVQETAALNQNTYPDPDLPQNAARQIDYSICHW